MKHTIFLLSFLLSITVWGQQNTFYLDKDFGLSPAKEKSTLSEGGYTATAAKAKWPNLFARYVAVGYAEATIMAFTEGVADHEEVVWRTHGAQWVNPSTGKPNPSNSRANIVWPHGRYMINKSCTIAHGQYTGQGTSMYYTTGSTELVMDNDRWIADQSDPNVRCIFRSTTWGDDGLMGYMENVYVHNFRFTGNAPQWFDNTFTRTSIGMWDMGEGGKIGVNEADHFDYGVICVRGTPFRMDYLTAFHCNIASLGLWGTALANISVGTLSLDDSPHAVYCIPAYGREGGGVGYFEQVKCETGITDESRGAYKGTIVEYAEGQIAHHFGTITYAANAVKTDAMFVINSKLQNGTPQNSSVSVDMLKGYGYAAVLQDIGAGTTWLSPGDYTAYGFTWMPGKMTCDRPVTSVSCNCKGRLGFLRNTGAFDRGACLPAFSLTGPNTTPPPTPTPCTGWASGSWSDCIDGKQIRTVTAIPSGCTGTPTTAKPAIEQVCTAPTPVPGTPLTVTPALKAEHLTNSDPNRRISIAVSAPVRKVVLVATWRRTTDNSYPYLLGFTVGTNTKAGIQALPTGKVQVNGVGATVSGSLLNGQASTITIVFDSPVTVTSLYNRSEANDAFQGTLSPQFYAQP